VTTIKKSHNVTSLKPNSTLSDRPGRPAIRAETGARRKRREDRVGDGGQVAPNALVTPSKSHVSCEIWVAERPAKDLARAAPKADAKQKGLAASVWAV